MFEVRSEQKPTDVFGSRIWEAPPMLSVIILCDESTALGRPEAVVRTLAPLVGAAVKGLVRDVVVAGPRERQLDVIGDHAGCAIIEADLESVRLREAFAAARRPRRAASSRQNAAAGRNRTTAGVSKF